MTSKIANMFATTTFAEERMMPRHTLGVSALYNRGIARIQQKKLDDAWFDFHAAGQQNSSFSTSLIEEGQGHLLRNRPQRAASSFFAAYAASEKPSALALLAKSLSRSSCGGPQDFQLHPMLRTAVTLGKPPSDWSQMAHSIPELKTATNMERARSDVDLAEETLSAEPYITSDSQSPRPIMLHTITVVDSDSYISPLTPPRYETSAHARGGIAKISEEVPACERVEQSLKPSEVQSVKPLKVVSVDSEENQTKSWWHRAVVSRFRQFTTFLTTCIKAVHSWFKRA